MQYFNFWDLVPLDFHRAHESRVKAILDVFTPGQLPIELTPDLSRSPQLYVAQSAF